MLCRRTSPGRRRAVTIVEMTVVALTFFIFMFAIFEYGRYVMARQVIDNAARTGARLASTMATSRLSTATANTNLTNAVTAALASQPYQNVAITAYQSDTNGNNTGAWTSTPFGQTYVVQVDADLPLIFPTFGFVPNNGGAANSVHITVKCMMRSEAN